MSVSFFSSFSTSSTNASTEYLYSRIIRADSKCCRQRVINTQWIRHLVEDVLFSRFDEREPTDAVVLVVGTAGQQLHATNHSASQQLIEQCNHVLLIERL